MLNEWIPDSKPSDNRKYPVILRYFRKKRSSFDFDRSRTNLFESSNYDLPTGASDLYADDTIPNDALEEDRKPIPREDSFYESENSPMKTTKVAPTRAQPSKREADQQSLHYEETAVSVEQQGSYATDISTTAEKRIMKNKIRKRECICFIEKKDQKSDIPPDERECCCGYKRKKHKKDGQIHPSTDATWNSASHTRRYATDGYGEIEFVGYGDKVAKFARVADDTSMEIMLDMLKEAWEVETPNLLISVTGGAKFFDMKTRLREVFRKGLMKAALSTGAWIITGGTNTGVMKIVGEAVRDYGLTSQGRVIAIGIAPWGCVQNKETLIDPEGKWPASYRIEGEALKKQSFLDPNHSHFILVDNGTQRQFKVEIPFRAKLEEAIGAKKTDKRADAVQVPVCLLVLNGGPGTLETVHSAIKSKTPTILIKGSGKAADILAFAHQNVREEEVSTYDHSGKEFKELQYVLDSQIVAKISDNVKDTFGEENMSQNVEWIKGSVTVGNLISVFELDSKNSATDVDLAILKALLKANKDQVMNQLRLALAWNRIDVAKSEIFTHDKNWTTGKLDDVMLSAIMLNRVDFVELFLDHGVSLRDFLSIERLLELYNLIPPNCLLHQVLTKSRQKHGKNIDQEQKNMFSLGDVGHLIQMLLGDFCQPEYLTNPNLITAGTEMSDEDKQDTSQEVKIDFTRPAQDLFIWAILMNKHKLSILFWREAKESVAAALFGQAVLKALQKHTMDAQVRSKLQANAEEFEQLAIGVINTCYSTDEKRAHDILIRNMPHWGSTTCMLLAYHSDNKRFITQTACQSLLSSIWMGKMSSEYAFLRILLCSIFFPLIPFLIKFKSKQSSIAENPAAEENKEKDNARPQTRQENLRPISRQLTKMNVKEKENPPENRKKKTPCLSQFVWFYTTPIVKFTTSVMFYFIFLTLYSYILVVKLSQDFHFLEGILIFWVVSIFTEEIRQFLMMYAFSLKSKLKYYFYDPWNLLDIITIGLFAFGMVLRFSGSSETLAAARIFLSLNLITFFLRVLHTFSINHNLGPILVMISDMVKDLMWFVIILLVFVFSYAIASEAILYPNSELNFKIFYYLPRKAYWHIYGELFLEDIEGENSCTNDPAVYNNYSQLRCPSDTGKYVVPVLLGVYILLTNVLLLNLLIAMFSYTFQKIRERSNMHWCFQRFSLVREYTQRPFLPPPFILLSHIALLIKLCFQSCRNEKYISGKFSKKFTNVLEEKQLIQWENLIADNYLSSSERNQANSLAGRVKMTNERLDVIMSKVEDIHESQGQGQIQGQGQGSMAVVATPTAQTVNLPSHVEKRLESVENQLIHTTKALEWIMQALQDGNMGTKRARPLLPNIEKQRQEAEKLKRDKISRDKKVVHNLLEMKTKWHSQSRISPYHGTKDIRRFNVPDDKVSWEEEYPEYNPLQYTDPKVIQYPGTDVDLMNLPIESRTGLIHFNAFDVKHNVNRESLCCQYNVIEGLPINPNGRTGLTGRGSLWRFGPNHAGDPIVTRWKMLPNGTCATANGKPVLEFVAAQRSDNNMWAIPGAICEANEEPLHILKTDFKVDVQGSLMDDPEEEKRVMQKLDDLGKQGKEVYRGYADDPRNTDNAWMETRVVNYHDLDDTILRHFMLRAGEEVQAVSWQTISSTLILHGSHSYFIKLVADLHKAAF